MKSKQEYIDELVQELRGDLSPDELDQLCGLFHTTLEDRRALKEPTQIGEIIPFKHWIEAPYYSGALGTTMYPFWKQEINTFIVGNYNEWVISGAIGTGKTTASLALFLYKLYYLSKWDYPQRLFSLPDTSKIAFAYLSISIQHAKLAGFGTLREYLDHTEYFTTEFKRDSITDNVIKFPQSNLLVIPGSSALSVISTDLFGVFLDEMNFLREGGAGKVGNIAKARDIYSQTTIRRRSRYLKQGFDPSFSILVSSSTHDQSFTEERKRKAEEQRQKGKEQVKTYFTNTSMWTAKPKGTYSTETFLVFNGGAKVDPFIVEDVRDFINIASLTEDRVIIRALLDQELSIHELYAKLPQHLRDTISEVPVDFLPDFKENILEALASLAGVSISPSNRLFSSRQLWADSISPDLAHPFRKETLPITVKNGLTITSFFDPEVLFKDGEFRRHPEAARYLHVDQSLGAKDYTGVSMVHVADMVEDPLVGIHLPIVETDFMLRIENPNSGDKINLEEIVKFILYLRNKHFVQFGLVSYDQYQSEMALQILIANGIRAERVSVDRTDKRWTTLVALLESGRFRQYWYEPFTEEFFKLIHDRVKHKVDHLPGNFKDVSDSVVGAVSSCVEGKHQHMSSVSAESMEQADFVEPEDIVDKKDNWLYDDYDAGTVQQVIRRDDDSMD